MEDVHSAPGSDYSSLTLIYTASMFACVFVCKVTSMSTRLQAFPSWELIQRTCARVFSSFQFKTLICMCEMCCAGVKCSAVPSRMKTSTHPFLSEDGGVLGKKENKKKGGKRGREGHWCLSSALREQQPYILYNRTSRNINTCLINCPLSHSVAFSKM